jgi:hypothetical protein
MKKNQTIAQHLNVTEFPFQIKDKNGKGIYYEVLDGLWYKCEYNSNGNEIYYENCIGTWVKKKYDSDGNLISIVKRDGNKKCGQSK